MLYIALECDYLEVVKLVRMLELDSDEGKALNDLADDRGRIDKNFVSMDLNRSDRSTKDIRTEDSRIQAIEVGISRDEKSETDEIKDLEVKENIMKNRVKSVFIKFLERIYWILLKPVYKVYEWKLYRSVKKGIIPGHVAIIPDGNRRWAERMGWERTSGHYYGYNKLKEVLKWLDELGVKAVTIYAMSYENCLYRSDEEKRNLFNIIRRGLKELESYSREKKVRVKVMGRLDLVPRDIIDLAMDLEKSTSTYDEKMLNIMLCYGGRQEIVDAFKKMYEDIRRGVLKIDDVNENTLSKYLYTGYMGELQEPDLVIRTSGEIRISNFLLWQSAYSELFFCEALWPEFRKIDLLRALRSYQRRERRFGR